MHGKPGRERLSLVSPKNINFVAMRSPAKSLSAAQTIDNVSFDDFYDGASLQELKNVFDQLAKQQPPPGLPATQDDGNRTGNVYTSPSYTIPGSKPPTGETVAEGADMATNVDINSLSEHDINSLSVVNTNTWVGGNSNTWVGGDAHNHIRNLQDDYYLAHQELTPTFHTEETGMHAEVTGIHIEDTEIHIEAHGIPVVQPGMHVEIENGLHYHIGDMDDFFWHNGRFELVDTDIRSYITKTKIAGDDTEIVEVKNIEAGILSVLGTTGVVIVTRGMSIDAFAGMDIYAPTVTIEGALVNIG